ncbi:MAG: hypothetical protein Kow00127_11070 [Bacteroidales bacterium]
MMKRFIFLLAALIVSGLFVQAQVLYQDDFESYTAGDYLAVSNPDWWTTWSNAPGGPEDPVFSDDVASSGALSVKVEGSNDAVLKLGDKVTGKYKLSFKYYVPVGFGAYYNIQHYENPGIEWAYEVYFGSNGMGQVDAGTTAAATFSFTNGEWISVENVFDLDNDWTQLYINGTLVYEWPFSYQSNNTTGTLQLGGMDVWAGAPTGDTPMYYMDDVVFESIPSALYFDDMESYTVGDYIAVSNPDWWTTWSNNPGSGEDALISDDVAYSGTNSVKVDGVTDLILKLGDKTSGKYQLKFWYYIPTGFGAYYNIQHFEAPGVEWAYEVYFSAAGTGQLDAGSASAATFDYPVNEWFLVDQIIDLTNDQVSLWIDENLVYEWPFSYQSTGTSGTNQLGGVDFYAGAPTGETPMYYFDDVEFVQLEAGSGAPVINVNPGFFAQMLELGSVSTDNLTIMNEGEAELNYDITITYPAESKTAVQADNGKAPKEQVITLAQEAPAAQPGGAPAPSEDVILHYDGDNSSAIGLTSGGDMRCAAVFTPEELGDYIGMQLTAIELYINDQPTATTLQVYDQGTMLLPGPGDLLYEQDFFGVPISWNVVDLDNPIYVDGSDLWVGYKVTHDAGTFPAGVDAGPHHPNGDWISSGPGWHHLSDNVQLDYNWNIRAHLTGEPIIQWLSATPMSGTLDVGASEDITLTFDATQLEIGEYSAELIINSNDPDNPTVNVPVSMLVYVGIDEVSKHAVLVYPNPATDYIHIQADNPVRFAELVTVTGQVVSRVEANGSELTIPTGNLDRGLYFVRIETEAGSVTHKITIR